MKQREIDTLTEYGNPPSAVDIFILRCLLQMVHSLWVIAVGIIVIMLGLLFVCASTCRAQDDFQGYGGQGRAESVRPCDSVFVPALPAELRGK